MNGNIQNIHFPFNPPAQNQPHEHTDSVRDRDQSEGTTQQKPANDQGRLQASGYWYKKTIEGLVLFLIILITICLAILLSRHSKTNDSHTSTSIEMYVPSVEWCGSPSLIRQAHAVGFGIAMQRVSGMISIGFRA